MQKRVLILSGPTHEYFDAVRYIGNASSGKMGKALAGEALARGFSVEFISGPVAEQNLPHIGNTHIHSIQSSEEMLFAARGLFQRSEIIIFAAAVADYAPAEKTGEKLPKSETELLLKLRPTPDIAKTLCACKQPGQTAIGFALQTSDGPAKARAKLKAKNLDGIVLNTPATLGADNGSFSFLAAGAEAFDDWGCIDKTECARKIFEAIDRL
ncbi:MAG: phosphopantothenoylcysteine decarboxylase [Kiritimatiellales bacterium]|nr:phosphopantothenoylcysteine decarboxylase [Kiritimatiellales bacterium]